MYRPDGVNLAKGQELVQEETPNQEEQEGENLDSQQTGPSSVTTTQPSMQRPVWPPVYSVAEYVVEPLDGDFIPAEEPEGDTTTTTTTRYAGIFIPSAFSPTDPPVLQWIFDLKKNQWIEIVRQEQIFYGRWMTPIKHMQQDIIKGDVDSTTKSQQSPTSAHSFIMHAIHGSPLSSISTLPPLHQNHVAPRFNTLPIYVPSSEDWVFWSQRALRFMHHLTHQLQQHQKAQKTAASLFNNLQEESQRMQQELALSMSLHEKLMQRVTMLETQNSTLKNDHKLEQDTIQLQLENERNKFKQIDLQIIELQEKYATEKRKWIMEQDHMNEQIERATTAKTGAGTSDSHAQNRVRELEQKLAAQEQRHAEQIVRLQEELQKKTTSDSLSQDVEHRLQKALNAQEQSFHERLRLLRNEHTKQLQLREQDQQEELGSRVEEARNKWLLEKNALVSNFERQVEHLEAEYKRVIQEMEEERFSDDD